MKRFLTLAVVATTLLSAACSKDDDGGNYNAPIAVQIDPTIADPALFPKASTRVTDTDFEMGDKIGVTITMEDNTQYLNNKEFSFDGTNFTAPGTLWYEDVNLASSLFAYYPYQAGAAHPAEFSVQTDQSGDNYKASDLVIGAKSGVKPEKTVDLAFKHKMTRVIVRVTNGSGSDITEIRIGGAVGTGVIDAKTGAFTAKTDAAPVEIKACERTKNQLYYALLVPQNGVKLITSVTTADGKTRPYTLGTTDLLSGTNRELKMNIQEADMQVELGGPIDGWDNGADLEIENGGTVIEPEVPTVAWGGVKYKIVTLKDGRTWMAENLRYVPEGKTVSSDPAEDAGIWYPAANAEKKADPALAETLGLLYDASTAFGVEVTAENAKSLEGTQGICPDGWHIPTCAEMTALVGHNSNGELTDPNGAYYDAAAKGALIPALNEAGFNWCFTGARNKANVTAGGTYLVNNYGDVYGAMSYVWGSTCHQVQNDATSGALKNIQFYSFMSTLNASNNKVSVAYGNFKSGYSVRCIKNAE